MHILKNLIVFLFLLFLTGCTDKPAKGYPGRIMVLSLSSDGRYVISSDFSQHVVLWDLLKHRYKVIASKVNIYSAYFIKHTHNFMYQSNRNNEVYVENVNGKIIRKFNPGFPTYGQVMTSDLSRYFASPESEEIVMIRNGKKRAINPNNDLSFLAAGKLFNLTLSKGDLYLVGSSGFGEVYIWNVQNGNLLHKVVKNVAQTYATITPDGKYVISGDFNSRDLLIDIKTGKVIKKYYFGYNSKLGLDFDKIYGPYTNEYIGLVVTIKFIDSTHFLVIFHTMPAAMNHAGLFSLNKTKAIKYLPLTNSKNHLAPVTQNYTRDQAIDTSPSAHILVMAQKGNNGILVYKYDPKQQTLKQIWAPVIT